MQAGSCAGPGVVRRIRAAARKKYSAPCGSAREKHSLGAGGEQGYFSVMSKLDSSETASGKEKTVLCSRFACALM